MSYRFDVVNGNLVDYKRGDSYPLSMESLVKVLNELSDKVDSLDSAHKELSSSYFKCCGKLNKRCN